MQTICRDGSNVSLYIFPDELPIIQYDGRLEVGNPVEVIISDCNDDNVTVYTNVTPPGDWAAWDYTFDGTTWATYEGPK